MAAQRLGTPRELSVRWQLAAIASLILIAGLVGLLIHGWKIHGDPDPGGQILDALRTVEAAVPPAAIDVSEEYGEAHWDSCDGRAGTFGWSEISVILTFGTTLDPSALISYVTGRLEAGGWTMAGQEALSPLGPNQKFSRTLANGTEAVADIGPQMRDGRTVMWSLRATAPPDGPTASGC